MRRNRTSINLNCQLQPNAGTIHQKCGGTSALAAGWWRWQWWAFGKFFHRWKSVRLAAGLETPLGDGHGCCRRRSYAQSPCFQVQMWLKNYSPNQRSLGSVYQGCAVVPGHKCSLPQGFTVQWVINISVFSMCSKHRCLNVYKYLMKQTPWTKCLLATWILFLELEDWLSYCH